MYIKAKIFLTLGIGLAIIAITLVLFLVGFSYTEKTAVDWLAMSFVLVSEVLLITGLVLLPVYKTKIKAALVSSGVYSALFAYWLTTALLAIFAKDFNIRAFISTQIIALGIVAIIIMALFISAFNVKNNKKTTE